MSESQEKTFTKYKTDMSLHVNANTSNANASGPSLNPLNKKQPSVGLTKTSKPSSYCTYNADICCPTHSNKNIHFEANINEKCKTPPVTPSTPSVDLNDDIASEYSVATTSGRCTMSCEHPYVARNGTTFSGSKMKYMIHASNHAGKVGSDYLTPTQRAQRQIKVLKDLLCVARQDLEKKDSEILKLTKEVVELRLFKVSLTSPDDRSASSDAVTVCEAGLKTSQDVSPIINELGVTSQQVGNFEMHSSFADSGHFEDMSTCTHDMTCAVDGGGHQAMLKSNPTDHTLQEYELQRQQLINTYEQRIEELIRNHESVNNELKRTHNDKIESLLQTLFECNTRYVGMVPDYEVAKERIRELERQLDDLQRKLADHEDKQKKMYLQTYHQQAESKQLAQADQALEKVYRTPNNVSIGELLKQLQNTQDELENIRIIYRRLLEAQKNHTHVDPDITLQFLKSAIYYFLTDKENSQGHLQAIESILEFTDAEKQKIRKAINNQ